MTYSIPREAEASSTKTLTMSSSPYLKEVLKKPLLLTTLLLPYLPAHSLTHSLTNPPPSHTHQPPSFTHSPAPSFAHSPTPLLHTLTNPPPSHTQQPPPSHTHQPPSFTHSPAPSFTHSPACVVQRGPRVSISLIWRHTDAHAPPDPLLVSLTRTLVHRKPVNPVWHPAKPV